MVELNLPSRETQNLRKLTKSEKRLSIILIVAVFAMANFYGLGYLLDLLSTSSREVSELQGQEHSNEIWLRQKDLWLDRKRWIEASQPRIRPNQVPQSELLESLTTSAKADQLEIQEQSFSENKSTPYYQSVAVRLKLAGPLQNAIKWLVQIQQPELFQAITNFSLKSANEPPTVSLELEVARWYAPNT
jgi:Tfp pilus assembly protein PilO